MEVSKQVVGKVNEKEVKEAICEYLAKKGYRSCDISFDIKMETGSDDTFASYPVQTVFEGVRFVGEEVGSNE